MPMWLESGYYVKAPGLFEDRSNTGPSGIQLIQIVNIDMYAPSGGSDVRSYRHQSAIFFTIFTARAISLWSNGCELMLVGLMAIRVS